MRRSNARYETTTSVLVIVVSNPYSVNMCLLWIKNIGIRPIGNAVIMDAARGENLVARAVTVATIVPPIMNWRIMLSRENELFWFVILEIREKKVFGGDGGGCGGGGDGDGDDGGGGGGGGASAAFVSVSFSSFFPFFAALISCFSDFPDISRPRVFFTTSFFFFYLLKGF